jgi:hypothetical protein
VVACRGLKTTVTASDPAGNYDTVFDAILPQKIAIVKVANRLLNGANTFGELKQEMTTTTTTTTTTAGRGT